MHRQLALYVALLSCVRSHATGLCEEARLAWADAQRLPKDEAPYWRYFTLYNLPDEKARELHVKVAILFQTNAISQESDFGRPVKVGPTLYRIYLLHYGENFSKAYENLAVTNPYFPCFERIQIQQVVPAKVVPVAQPTVKVWVFRQGAIEIGRADVREGEKCYEQTGENTYRQIGVGPGEKVVPVAPVPIVSAQQVDPRDIKIAAFLPAVEMLGLATLLKTRVPLVRADWFFYRTSISVNRNGDGYFDFHGFKSRDDAYKLAGLDLKQIARLKSDMAATLSESGVATNNARQVWWVKTYAGSWWQTFDVNSDAVGKKNLVTLKGDALNKVDFDHDAEETFFNIPNGLFGYIANNNQGVLQQFVPVEIASDGNSPSNDKRIHTGSMSCAGCHVEGLRPIDDWAREVYRKADDPLKTGQALLGAPDPKKRERLKRLYLSEMPEQLEIDNAAYAKKLHRLNGMKPAELAAGVYKVYQDYANAKLGLAEQAVELGVKKEHWERALRNHIGVRTATGQLADELLTGAIAPRPRKIGRPQWEERFPVAQAILGEVKP